MMIMVRWSIIKIRWMRNRFSKSKMRMRFRMDRLSRMCWIRMRIVRR